MNEEDTEYLTVDLSNRHATWSTYEFANESDLPAPTEIKMHLATSPNADAKKSRAIDKTDGIPYTMGANDVPLAEKFTTASNSIEEINFGRISFAAHKVAYPEMESHLVGNMDSNTNIISTTPEIPTFTESDSSVYYMDHKWQGNAIVFNHLKVEDEEDRVGTKIDEDKIRITFERLGFNVIVYNDLKLSDIRETVKQLKAEDYSNHNCFVLFILTHGYKNGLVKAQDEIYSLESIWEKFTATNCPQLAGKPKLFFFQVCRGHKADPGVKMRLNSTSQTDSAGCSYKIPSYSDFLIGHSTFEDHVSWRNPDKGSWYIQTLCEVLDTYSDTEDLLSMMTIVARKVSAKSSDTEDAIFNEKMQMPSIMSTLMRKLYFKPRPN